MNPQPPTPSTQENKTEPFSVRPLELFEHSGSQLSQLLSPRNDGRWVPSPSIQCGSGSLESLSPSLLADLSTPSHFCLPLLWLPMSPPPSQYSCPSMAGVGPAPAPHCGVSSFSIPRLPHLGLSFPSSPWVLPAVSSRP